MCIVNADTLPQMSEAMEIEDALQKGIPITSGHRPKEDLPNTYNVGGILLPRPFKVTRIGPVGLFVTDMDRAEAFYTELLGFVKTEDVRFKGRRCLVHAQHSQCPDITPAGCGPLLLILFP